MNFKVIETKKKRKEYERRREQNKKKMQQGKKYWLLRNFNKIWWKKMIWQLKNVQMSSEWESACPFCCCESELRTARSADIWNFISIYLLVIWWWKWRIYKEPTPQKEEWRHRLFSSLLKQLKMINYPYQKRIYLQGERKFIQLNNFLDN